MGKTRIVVWCFDPVSSLIFKFLNFVPLICNLKIICRLGKQNSSRALSDPVKGRGEPIDKDTFEFEGKMIQVMLNATSRSAGFQSFPNVNRSFGDIASSTILGDVGVMAIGKLVNYINSDSK